MERDLDHVGNTSGSVTIMLYGVWNNAENVLGI